MRIGINFHAMDRYISGVEYYSLGLVNSLLRAESGNEYVVFTNQPRLVRKHVVKSENLTIRNLSNLKTRWQRILWEHVRLPQIVKKERLDILHCPHYICPCPNAGVPYVVTIHDTIAIDHPGWCKPSNVLYYNILMKPTIRNASRVIAVSRCTADRLEHHFPSSHSKTKVIYPGVDPLFTKHTDQSQHAKVRAKYALPEQYILFVGNIEPKKNLLTLLHAYKLLSRKGLSHKLVLAGKRTWRSSNVWKQIRQESRLGNIVYIGYVERQDLPFVYKMADVFVFVSLCEGFGFPPLEAMACGTPVVASGRGILEETKSKAYFLTNPDNPEEISQALYLLITDAKLRQKYIEIGIEQSACFNWQDCAEQTLSVYKEAIESDGQL